MHLTVRQLLVSLQVQVNAPSWAGRVSYRLDDGYPVRHGGKLRAFSRAARQSLGIFATILLIRAVLTLTNPVHRASIATHSPNMSEQTGMGS